MWICVYLQENMFKKCTQNVCVNVRRQSSKNEMGERKSNIVL